MSYCLMCQNRINEYFDLEWVLSLQQLKKKFLCKNCQNNLVELINYPRCPGCGRKMNKEDTCIDCRKWGSEYSDLLGNIALYEYNELMKKYFEKFKFMGDYYYSNIFNGELKEIVQKKYGKGWLFVPVPLSKQSFQIRMFNQVEALFSGLTFTELLAVRNDEKIKQSKLNRRERLRRRQPFVLNSNKRVEIEAANILLLDDIYTTGGTLYHAARIMKDAGAKKIKSITLAR
ncbi:ComF family protein [Liquorilactobacillus mali]|nr:phosphoribosyltransferase family protein [Liquorilactobacillus mali]EJF00167.1 amidophosphoribosyltransferase [Liquorilactobacillus mali KCTC 3596 = DSM 20444]MDC7953257.1 ComF family protein [Liquorilactobacillus mali]MDV7756699.1 ComF family protein [Liquorilactobacillus mali]QFQ74190.1 ComF family protein [Liquorilactobacillus mali]